MPLPTADAIEAHPPKPILSKLIVGDITIEKLGMVLPHTDKLMLFRDELSAFINALNKYTNTKDDERKFYLELFTGSSIETDRVGRDSIYIKDPCLNILGGIQPDVLVGISNKSNDGFMDRFGLIAYPDGHIKFDYIDDMPNVNYHNEIKKMFTALESSSWETLPARSKVIPIYCTEDDLKKCVEFDLEAQAGFTEWMTKITNSASTGTCVDGFISKKPGLLAKVALVLHLVKVVSDEHKGGCDKISITTLNDSIKIIDEYFEPMWKKAMSIGLTNSNKSQRMLKFLKDHPTKMFTVRDVKQKGLSGLTNDGEVIDLIDSLLQLNWVRVVESSKSKTGGRPTVKYEINPKIKITNDFHGCGGDM